jgi:hypothetical protein
MQTDTQTMSRFAATVATIAATVLVGLGHMTAEAQEKAGNGEGPAHYYAQMEALVQPGPSVTGCLVDLSALLSGRESTLSPEGVRSVEVRPRWGIKPGEPVPSRVEMVDGICRVLWAVPGASDKLPAGSVMPFQLAFFNGTHDKAPALPDTKDINLVTDGDFSALPEGQPPAGMSATALKQNFRMVELDGGQALAFNADPEGRGPVYRTEWLAVAPGTAYEFSFRYRIQDGSPHPRYNLLMYSYVNFRDKDGEKIPRVSVFRTFNRDTGGWQECTSTITIPESADFANLEIRNGSTVPYSVMIDRVTVAPVLTARVTELRTSEGERITTRAEGEYIRRFDLGPASSAVWEGFTALTPDMKYDADRTYGFARLDRPRAANRTRPDALARDFIASPRAELVVDLPDGEYDIFMLTGDSQVGSVVYWLYFNRSVTVNGETVLNNDTHPAEFFKTYFLKNYDNFWTPDLDYYDAFVASRFETHRFAATVGEGKLRIEWQNLPVAAMIIAPRQARTQVEREWEQLARARRQATPVEEKPGPDDPMPQVTAAEKERGFVLFRKPANVTVYPASRPTEDEKITELRLFAAPGQTESVHFSLLPLEDLGAVSVQPGALRSDGSEIPAGNVTVRVARYIFKQADRTRHLQPGYTYRVAPFPLDVHDPVPSVDAGVSYTWWATVAVPEGTPPGIYRGSLVVSPGPGFDLPVQLRVVPFSLDPLPIVQGYYYMPSEPWYSTFWRANVMGANYRNDPDIRALIAEHERRELAFMKSIGLNSAAFGDDLRGDLQYADGNVTLKTDDRFSFWMDIYSAAGMGPMPFYGFQPIGGSNNLSWLNRDILSEQFTDTWKQAYRSLVRNVQSVARDRGWPEILWYVTDEKSNHGEEGAIMGKRLAETLEDMPGVTTIASMNGPWEHIMVPHLDISMPNIAFPITEETVAMIRDAGSKLWIYNCGDERITLGLYPWRLKAGGRFQWHYRSMVADPWDDLDGTYGESAYSLSLPAPDGPVPTLDAETVRDAITDHRYAATLEHALETARENPAKRAVVERAERFLDDLRDRIPVDVRTLIGFRVDPRAAGAAVGGEFKNVEALDRVRWAMAQFIIELREEGQ